MENKRFREREPHGRLLRAMSRSSRPDGSEVVVCDSSKCKRSSKQIAVVHNDIHGFTEVLDGDIHIEEDFGVTTTTLNAPRIRAPS